MSLCSSQIAKADYTVNGNDVLYKSNDGCLRIEMCSQNMFRVTKSATAEFLPNEEWMVVKYDFDIVNFKASENAISTDELDITITDTPWRIKVQDKAGNILYNELDAKLADENNGPATTVTLQPDEHFFGFGERMDHMDQRGQNIHLNVELGSGPKPAVGGKDILRANYCPVPWFMSSKGYGIFFHTAFPTDWDMGWTSHKSYTFKADGGELDYYFIAGPSFEKMLHSYQTLTGNCPMMPRTAYGLHLGSYSGGTWNHEECTTDTYNIDLIHRMRKEKIPVDLLWLDSTWRYFNNGHFKNGGCCWEWRNTFKDPQAMIDTIYANHIDMFGLHIRSIIDDGLHTSLFTEAKKQGYVLIDDGKDGGTINFFDPKAADWWWDNAVMRVAKMGVKFVKTDCGGVYRLEGKKMSDVYPGKTNAEVHNLFTLPYAKVPYEKFGEYNNQRGFNHTREGYAGIQRYPFIWAGDWGTEWQWFEPVIRAGLNIGLSGVGYWSHCMGGFEQYSPYDTDLYLRWCQFGMFSPVSILFGMDHPRYHEPWTYGEEAMNIFTKYDSIRYTLIPYIYSNAYTMYETSRPLMTPMLYDYTSDEVTYNISDQFMFGKSMMICPVVNKGALSRPVYFPGGKWVDFWTGERIDTRRWKSFLTPQWLMPIYIKEDAIIPKQQELQYLNGDPVKELTISCYPVSSNTYRLYEDDGKSLDYKKGVYSATMITSEMKDGEWTLTIAKPTGSYKAPEHTYNAEAYLDVKPSAVTVNGKALAEGTGWTYDEELRQLKVFTTATNSKKDVVIKAK